jgi:hypothetical protein
MLASMRGSWLVLGFFLLLMADIGVNHGAGTRFIVSEARYLLRAARLL